jgi:hypothetical protein
VLLEEQQQAVPRGVGERLQPGDDGGAQAYSYNPVIRIIEWSVENVN